MITNIFIQARMSSSRFPGKVLASLNNKTIIKYILESAKKVKIAHKVVVLTSGEESDDPLAYYLKQLGCNYFRGNLNDVFDRFQSAATVFPCDYLVRLSADSPFLDSDLITFMIQQALDYHADITSNVIVRTFPKGQSVEVIKTKTLLEIDKALLTQEEREHVFPYFYRNKDKFKIRSIKNNGDESDIHMCIDTWQDLVRLSLARNSYKFQQNVYAE